MYDPEKHHRHSIRLKGYDYSSLGKYFITTCAHNRECIFGHIQNDEMVLNDVGQGIWQVWNSLPTRFPSMDLNEFVVMPNHVHGIIVIAEIPRGAENSAPTLGEIMRAFKSISAIDCNRILEHPRRPFWQSGYYEHIVRDRDEYGRIAAYIVENPADWDRDKENPQAQMSQPEEPWQI